MVQHRQGRVAVLVAAGLVLGALCGAAPVLVIEPETYDWGRQEQNRGEYRFRFVLRNRGDATLEITQVRPTCSCTTAELKTRRLSPGASAELTGVLTTTGMNGRMNKGILISANDPERPVTVANLRIRFPLDGVGLRLRSEVTPARIIDGALRAPIVAENCEAGTPIEIQAMELPEGWNCPVTLPIMVPPEESVVVPLVRALPAGADPEPFDDLAFTLITDSAKTPRLRGLLLYHRSAPPAQASPASPPGPAR